MNLYNFENLSPHQQAVKIFAVIDRLLLLLWHKPVTNSEKEGGRVTTVDFEAERDKLDRYCALFFRGRNPSYTAVGEALPFGSLQDEGTHSARALTAQLQKIRYSVADAAGIPYIESDFRNLFGGDESESLEGKAILPFRLPVTVVCDNLRSPFNIGSIIRTAEAFSFSKVILTGISALVPTNKINRTSMCAENFIEVIRLDESRTVEFVTESIARGALAAALEKKPGAVPLSNVSFSGQIILIVGNEEFGVSEAFCSICPVTLEIPLGGVKNSLNVASAFAIAAYSVAEEIRK